MVEYADYQLRHGPAETPPTVETPPTGLYGWRRAEATEATEACVTGLSRVANCRILSGWDVSSQSPSALKSMPSPVLTGDEETRVRRTARTDRDGSALCRRSVGDTAPSCDSHADWRPTFVKVSDLILHVFLSPSARRASSTWRKSDIGKCSVPGGVERVRIRQPGVREEGGDAAWRRRRNRRRTFLSQSR
ncbi:hypothetical protein EYF80_045045 [Liparis tanakae]|uniref:Uncharacterized protein n=1 Tax=Liparis tanakae TaxID=230148 RepID=A0A4Z2FV64_9TELE|nr:hypothetical protein EYF80_045045 [Liparis tanakae]